MRSGRGYLLSGAVMICAMLLTGCTKGDTQDPQGEPAIGDPVSITDLKTYSLPLDAFEASPMQNVELDRARLLLLEDCLKRFGFDLTLPDPVPPPYTGNERRYGLADLDAARTRGYHPPREALAKRVDSVPKLPPAAEAIASGEGVGSAQGVPKGGCLGEAQRKISANAPATDDPMLAEALSSQSYEQSRNDSRVLGAMSKWSDCMRRSGYEYDSSDQAINDRRFHTEEPTALELAVASADVECKNEADLVEVWATVEVAYQQRSLEQNRDRLRVIEQILHTQLSNAASIAARR
ncbi:hypothetical protein ACTMSW_14995 [Micromonospora sp. BQ11]|uniref:hypothetical protein n=1 Tax=Micromonospora sp. BQ11 TaxID=3452212 RepID=UPI003F8BA8D3